MNLRYIVPDQYHACLAQSRASPKLLTESRIMHLSIRPLRYKTYNPNPGQVLTRPIPYAWYVASCDCCSLSAKQSRILSSLRVLGIKVRQSIQSL